MIDNIIDYKTLTEPQPGEVETPVLNYEVMVIQARKILIEGFKFDGHTVPKYIVRAALEALGIPKQEQP
jgi:hypothetical protein